MSGAAWASGAVAPLSAADALAWGVWADGPGVIELERGASAAVGWERSRFLALALVVARGGLDRAGRGALELLGAPVDLGWVSGRAVVSVSLRSTGADLAYRLHGVGGARGAVSWAALEAAAGDGPVSSSLLALVAELERAGVEL